MDRNPPSPNFSTARTRCGQPAGSCGRRFYATAQLGSPEARETARKCFQDLNYLFKLCGELEPGLLGKPHGGRAGPNTSFDQSACPGRLLRHLRPRTDDTGGKGSSHRELAGNTGITICAVNWVMNLFGILHRIVEPVATVSVMKYLACMYAAYELTDETEFRDEVFKHLREIIPMLPFPTNPYPTCHNLYYWALLCEYWSRTEIGGEADWIGYIGEYWKAARAARDSEGLSLAGYYDTEDGSFTPYPNRWLTHEDSKSNAPWGGKWGHAPEKEGVRTWVSATNMNNRALCSGMFAALGLLARSHGLDDNAHELARQTLLRMDSDSLRWWWDDGNLPDELKGLHNIFGARGRRCVAGCLLDGGVAGSMVAVAQSEHSSIADERNGWEEKYESSTFSRYWYSPIESRRITRCYYALFKREPSTGSYWQGNRGRRRRQRISTGSRKTRDP